MEEMKRRFSNEIAARLSGAAESDAESEMIEELAENLARRYEDMTAAGTEPEEAFAKAMEELGDADELVAYLNSLDPEEPLPEGGAGGEDWDEFVRQMKQMGSEAMDEAKKAVRLSQDFLRKLKERGGTWYNSNVTGVDVDEDGNVTRVFTGREKSSVSVRVDWDDGKQQYVASEGLMSLDVETVAGDVTILVDEDGSSPDRPIRVEGDVDRLDIFVSEAGVFTVREKRTASNQFFSFRGMSSADVKLTIPARVWDGIRVVTASGDVDIGDGLRADKLDVRTANGDLDCQVETCGSLSFKSASGDMSCEGHVERLRAETASGDVELDGSVGEAVITTASGDVTLSGTVGVVRAKSMSGDIQVESRTLPAGMELSSKSGDVQARIPDTGPFAVRLHTVSGEVDYRFPRQWNPGDIPGESTAPQYTLSSVSGDVILEKY